MRYLVTLYGDESTGPEPGTPEFDAELAAYMRFGETAGPAIVAGEALEPSLQAATVRAGDGGPLVTDGPFIETVEVIGGFYVLEADTLDDVLDLARQIPAALDGAVEVRPLVGWWDYNAEPTAEVGAGTARYVAFIYGKETAADVPDTPEWEAGAANHQRFVEKARTDLRAGGALHPVATATTVRVRDGEVLVTDGPYAESAEVIGGLYCSNPVSRDRANELAAQIPVNPGGAIELRPIMELGG